MDQEPRIFFLTAKVVRRFKRIVMKGMGPRDHPHLRVINFAQYKRILCIAHTDDAALVENSRQAAAPLQLDYDYHYTGYGDLTAFPHNLCLRRQPFVAACETHGY